MSTSSPPSNSADRSQTPLTGHNHTHTHAHNHSHSHDTAPTVPPPTFNLALPSASQPDIIRANQKDSYYQQILKDQVKDAVREIFGKLEAHVWFLIQLDEKKKVCLPDPIEQSGDHFLKKIGSRTQHMYQTEVEVFSDLCYYSLTTLLGTQTLGEEYCDIVQIMSSTSTFPSLPRRSALVFWHVLVPYLYSKGTQELRKRTRPQQHQHRPGHRLDATLSEDPKKEPSQAMIRLKGFVQNWLPTLQNFFKTHGHSAHLAVFYFFGAYYSFSKRVTGIRYIFNRKLSPGEERSGYEVLGVLIVIQLVIQFYQWRRQVAVEAQEKKAAELLAVGNILGEKAAVVEEEEEEEEEMEDDITQTTAEINVRKCTLCLDPRTNTTATPCGHLFCWTCIREWCQNKPECPLCRQHVQLSALLPIYTKLY